MNTINLGVCSPSQVININIAVNDFSLLEFYNNNIVLNNEELENHFNNPQFFTINS